jgi:hypothetical protein
LIKKSGIIKTDKPINPPSREVALDSLYERGNSVSDYDQSNLNWADYYDSITGLSNGRKIITEFKIKENECCKIADNAVKLIKSTTKNILDITRDLVLNRGSNLKDIVLTKTNEIREIVICNDKVTIKVINI